MKPARMATRADYLEMFGMSKSEIAKRHAEKHGLKVIDIKLFNQEERDERDGYEDATCDRTTREVASLAYHKGFLEGKLAKIDWAIEDLKDLVNKMRA